MQQVIEKNEGQATELVAQAGLHLAKPTTHGPQPLEARPGNVSGEVSYLVPSAGGGAHTHHGITGGWSQPISFVVR